MRKSIGILVNSNGKNGICKLAALMANDLADENTEVTIHIPIMPYYLYYIKIFKKPVYYCLKLVPFYLKKYFSDRTFGFYDILSKDKVSRGLIKTKYFLISINKRVLSQHSILILNGIGDVVAYENKFPQVNQVYLVNQIEEEYHGAKYIRFYENIRKGFKGLILTHCEFMKRKFSHYIEDIRVVPNPISPQLWKHRNSFSYSTPRKDILFYIKGNNIIKDGIKTLEKTIAIRPETSITLFARSLPDDEIIRSVCAKLKAELLIDLNESDVIEQYLNHSFLFYPNRFEDFGMPPVEGLACGCLPVLRPDTGAADMYAVNNFNSIHLTDDDDLNAANIVEYLNNPEEIVKLRKNAPKNIDSFSPENYGKRILNI